MPGSGLREAGRLPRAAPSRRGAEGEGGRAAAARSRAELHPRAARPEPPLPSSLRGPLRELAAASAPGSFSPRPAGRAGGRPPGPAAYLAALPHAPRRAPPPSGARRAAAAPCPAGRGRSERRGGRGRAWRRPAPSDLPLRTRRGGRGAPARPGPALRGGGSPAAAPLRPGPTPQPRAPAAERRPPQTPPRPGAVPRGLGAGPRVRAGGEAAPQPRV